MSEFNFGSRKHPDTSKKTRRAIFAEDRIKSAHQAANERNEYCSSLNLLDRLKALDVRLGANVGAIKERARIKNILETEEIVKESKKKIKEMKPAETSDTGEENMPRKNKKTAKDRDKKKNKKDR